jgi:hypothetical protein
LNSSITPSRASGSESAIELGAEVRDHQRRNSFGHVATLAAHRLRRRAHVKQSFMSLVPHHRGRERAPKPDHRHALADAAIQMLCLQKVSFNEGSLVWR